MHKILLFCLALVLFVSQSIFPKDHKSQKNKQVELSLTDQEFAHIIQNFSEDNGQWSFDNLVSNEKSYLQIMPGIHKLKNDRGGYIGVAPDQNFTYIAQLKSQFAFIVDIRRGNMLELLIYKAIFELAENSELFLNLLLARRGTIKEVLADASGEYDRELAAQTLQKIKSLISQNYLLHFDAEDSKQVEAIYLAFCQRGGQIKCDQGPMQPTYSELIFEKDNAGKHTNYLLNPESYNYIRDMQRRNLIIPVVGNFVGSKAFKSIAQWLKEKNLTVSAFYVSSVEYHIFKPIDWPNWMINLNAIPWSTNALIIRTVPFPERNIPNCLETREGYERVTLVQRMKEYLGLFQKIPKERSQIYKQYIKLSQLK